MNLQIIYILIQFLIFYSPDENLNQSTYLFQPEKEFLQDRFNTPNGFERINVDENSFAAWLRQLPLKPEGSKVKYYDGSIKEKPGVYLAVMDLPIGTKNLHQCADAVIRLRAEYLYDQKRYDEIRFHFTNGFLAEYSKWMAGYRIKVSGNEVSWVKSVEPSNTPDTFWKYLETVFTYAGTLSLEKELKAVPINEMQIGDVFIQGGSPGHAVIVVDMAQNPTNGKKVFMLAQSYMPAQEIQILQNQMNGSLSPWYNMEFGNFLETPEWTFENSNLKRF
ncbi:MAG TPA: DUF4846 domain-containing protein [Bacteroidales bacterium]|nr:DUF4846 domain-containing protein [Bacteroidales bacterium]HRX98336.1 DUF4846 domain-containing protein [Bacteroidales bacterium]